MTKTRGMAATQLDERITLLNKHLRAAGWLVVTVLGFVQACANRHVMGPDGVSYLDVADKYLQRDWTWAVNAYWSPLYSWLIGAAFAVLRPSPYWQYTVVHLVNFVVYLLAFASFDFLLVQLIKSQRQVKGDLTDEESTLPAWAWQAIGYLLFLWCTIVLITLAIVTPDMIVAACVFLLMGLLCRIRLHGLRWLNFALFGLVLGIAYLAKAVMFPLAFAFLIVCFFSVGNVRRAIPRVLLSFGLFLVVSSPFLLALHHAKGRWTFGDSGRLAYAWLIDGTDAYIHWQGDRPNTGVPAHPTRKIWNDPPVFEFREPIKATYPPWYDASYWNEGLVGYFDARGQVAVFVQSGLMYYLVFVYDTVGMAILMSFLVLQVYLDRRVWTWITRIRQWHILVPSVAALALYSLIHVETRYIGAFVITIWLGLFSGVRLPNDTTARRLTSSVVIPLVVVGLLVIGVKCLKPAYATLNTLIRGENARPNEHWQIADGLRQMGIGPGDQLGFIGYGFGSGYWARLAKVQIIAEIASGSAEAPRKDVDRFWHSNEEIKRGVIDAFAKTGAKAIVAKMPQGASYPGWQRIGNTDHFVYFLR
jgi:4-amino-4-deoxy-L-arabinose transferase-like glycosyltransferase